MCGIQFKDLKKSTDLMFMLGLSETIDQLAMVNSVRWYLHVLRREDGHVLRLKVEGRKRKKQVEEDSVKVGLRMEDALCRSKWSGGVNQIAGGSM